MTTHGGSRWRCVHRAAGARKDRAAGNDVRPGRRRAVQLAAVALPVAVAAAVGCSRTPTAPAFPADAPPSVFRLSVYGFGFGSHDVTLKGDTLVVVRTFMAPDSVRTSWVVPERAEWSAFWRAADAAGVRAWPRQCAANDIVDGGGFTLEIDYPGGRIASTGSNAYPRRDGRCISGGTTADYQAFLDAVGALIGQSYP